jgi:RNA polymerase sigma factor FliA
MSTDDDRFVRENEGLVKKLAHRIRAELDLKVDMDDLVGYGMTGLVEARSRYDASRGVQFNTFAYYRIRGAILDGVRTMAYLPRRVHQKRRAAEMVDWELEAAGETRASAATKPDAEQTLAAVDDILGKITATFMLAAVGQDETAQHETPEDQVIQAGDRAALKSALHVLPERELAIVHAIYFEGRNLDDIGAELGISKSWACRIHARAITMLRDAMGL